MVRFRQIVSTTKKNETEGYKLVQSNILILTILNFCKRQRRTELTEIVSNDIGDLFVWPSFICITSCLPLLSASF